MARGFDTLADIERAITDLRQQESALSNDIEGANTTRTAQMRERTQLYRQLAEARAKSALADGVIDEADKLESDVAMILAGRQRTIERLKEGQAAIVERQSAAISESNANLTTIAEHEQALDVLAETIRAELAAEPVYAERKALRDRLAAHHAKASEKAEQAKQTRIEKGAPYERDPLFMYLWGRNYRQSGYSAGPPIRMLDDWVARLIGYQGARPNYAMLREIPERLQAHANRLKAELHLAEAACDELVAQRLTARDESGIARQLQEARTRQTAIDARLSAVETELNEAGNQINRFSLGTDDTFKLAVDMMAAFLEKDRYTRLVVEARWTPETTDDEIIARIGQLNSAVERLESETRTRRTDLDRLGQRREELIRIAAEFRRKSYHQPGSVFEPDYDMEDLLKDVVKGVLTGAEYWARAQRRQRWSSRSADPFRRQSGFPPFDFDIGGFGGGRSGGGGGGSRGGGGGGGDFRTGGGF